MAKAMEKVGLQEMSEYSDAFVLYARETTPGLLELAIP